MDPGNDNRSRSPSPPPAQPQNAPCGGPAHQQNGNANAEGRDQENAQQLYDPSVHKIALVRFYGHTSANTKTTTVDTSLIHKFDYSRPIGDYLVPRQDAKGLISYEPAQVIKLAATRGELEFDKNAPINKDKRTVFSKKRYSNLFDHLLARDGPIGGEDDEESLCSNNSEDGDQENAKKTTTKKIQKGNKRNPKKPPKKKVPQPKEVSQEDLEILEFQAKEMPGLQFSIDDQGELQDLKIRLVRTESERAELEAKLGQVVREKRIQDEMIERLALRIDSLERNERNQLQDQDSHHEPVRRRLNMDDLNSLPSTSRDSGNGSRSVRTIHRATIIGKRRYKPPKNSERKDLGNFTPSDYQKFKTYEVMKPGELWVTKDPKTGEEIIMKHLCFNESIPNESWLTFKNKEPSVFARDCFRAFYTEERAANRAVNIDRCNQQLDFNSPRKPLTPKKFACLKVMYERQVDKKVPREKRQVMKKKLNDILGQVINTAFQSQKQRQGEESSSDLGSMSSQFISDPEVERPLHDEHRSSRPNAPSSSCASSLHGSRATFSRPLSPLPPSTSSRSTTTRHNTSHRSETLCSRKLPPFSAEPGQAQFVSPARESRANELESTYDRPRSPLTSAPSHRQFNGLSPSHRSGTDHHRARLPVSSRPHQAATNIAPSRNRTAHDPENTYSPLRSPAPTPSPRGSFTSKSLSYRSGTTHCRARFPFSSGLEETATTLPARKSAQDPENTYDQLRSPATSASSRGFFTRKSPSYRSRTAYSRLRSPVSSGSAQVPSTPPSRNISAQSSLKTYDQQRSPPPLASSRGSFTRKSPSNRSRTAYSRLRSPVSSGSAQVSSTPPLRNISAQSSLKTYDQQRSPPPSASSRSPFTRKSPSNRSVTDYGRVRSPLSSGPGQLASTSPSHNKSSQGWQKTDDHQRPPPHSASSRGSFTRQSPSHHSGTAFGRLHSLPLGPGQEASTLPSHNGPTHGSRLRYNPPCSPSKQNQFRKSPKALPGRRSPPKKRQRVGEIEGCKWLSRPMSDTEPSRMNVKSEQSRITNTSESPSLLNPAKRPKRRLQILSSSSSTE
ncbi:hypothetical protein QAD02_002342 [Eretmocerus hayati]|uniref:Uncharacterized protein n=1 Tax=Eretmocerus hayati TaxID=131215 RepID=A0ACC2NJL0_9HYME|nr:hypothetical protein QAD02_002342 [Eretmocerus hayati]